MANLGTTELNVSIQGLIIPFTFIVFDNLAHRVILGVDFLQHSQADLCFQRKLISFYDGLVSTALLPTHCDESLTLLLQETITIPPLTEALIPTYVRGKCIRSDYIVDALPSVKSQLIAVAAALVRPYYRRVT